MAMTTIKRRVRYLKSAMFRSIKTDERINKTKATGRNL